MVSILTFLLFLYWFTGVVLTIIFVAWVLATLAGTMSEFLDKKDKKFYGVIVTVNFFFVPLTIILGAYGTIFRIARAHARGRGVSSFKKVHVLLFRLDYQPFKRCSRTRHCKYRNVRKFITFCSKAIKRRGDNVFGIYIRAGSIQYFTGFYAIKNIIFVTA